MKPVGIGLVGAGAFGVFCLEAFAVMPSVRIVAIADVDGERARVLAKQFGAKAYDSLDGLLGNADVEIVALNTPPYLHAEQGLAVLQAGRHLFCEKPLALTIEDGERLIQAARDNGVFLTVDYVMRHNPFWKAVAKLAQSGVFGALRHMDLANHAAGLALADDHWFWDSAKSGGIWIEHGVHFFDAFAWVAGETGEISGSQAFTRPDGMIDRVEALARFGKTAAHFYHAFDQSSLTEQTTVILAFEHAYLTLREWVPTSLEILTSVEPENFTVYLPGHLSISLHVDGRFIVMASEAQGKAAIYRQSIQDGMNDLVKAIQSPEHTLTVSGEAGLESLRLAVSASQLMTDHHLQ